MTLDEFRAEAAGWIGRPVDDFDCTAWVHEPGQRPRMCPLADADALSVPRAEYVDEAADAPADGPPTGSASGRGAATAEGSKGEPCTLHEVKVVYVLAQHVLGFRGAVQPSESGRSWNLYRDE